MFNFVKIKEFKFINLILFLGVVFGVGVIEWYFVSGRCIEACSYEQIEGFFRPVSSGGKVLAIILGLLLFVPQHIFKKWFFWFAIPGVMLITLFVSGISVYESGMFSWSRSVTTKFLMELLGVVTVLFVIGHLGYDYWKKREVVRK